MITDPAKNEDYYSIKGLMGKEKEEPRKLFLNQWTFRDSNPGQAGYEPAALTN